jgi:hypothetical protein
MTSQKKTTVDALNTIMGDSLDHPIANREGATVYEVDTDRLCDAFSLFLPKNFYTTYAATQMQLLSADPQKPLFGENGALLELAMLNAYHTSLAELRCANVLHFDDAYFIAERIDHTLQEFHAMPSRFPARGGAILYLKAKAPIMALELLAQLATIHGMGYAHGNINAANVYMSFPSMSARLGGTGAMSSPWLQRAQYRTTMPLPHLTLNEKFADVECDIKQKQADDIFCLGAVLAVMFGNDPDIERAVCPRRIGYGHAARAPDLDAYMRYLNYMNAPSDDEYIQRLHITDKNILTALRKYKSDPIPPLDTDRSDSEIAWNDAITSMMHWDPAMRPATVYEVFTRMREIEPPQTMDNDAFFLHVARLADIENSMSDVGERLLAVDLLHRKLPGTNALNVALQDASLVAELALASRMATTTYGAFLHDIVGPQGSRPSRPFAACPCVTQHLICERALYYVATSVSRSWQPTSPAVVFPYDPRETSKMDLLVATAHTAALTLNMPTAMYPQKHIVGKLLRDGMPIAMARLHKIARETILRMNFDLDGATPAQAAIEYISKTLTPAMLQLIESDRMHNFAFGVVCKDIIEASMKLSLSFAPSFAWSATRQAVMCMYLCRSSWKTDPGLPGDLTDELLPLTKRKRLAELFRLDLSDNLAASIKEIVAKLDNDVLDAGRVHALFKIIDALDKIFAVTGGPGGAARTKKALGIAV